MQEDPSTFNLNERIEKCGLKYNDNFHRMNAATMDPDAHVASNVFTESR